MAEAPNLPSPIDFFAHLKWLDGKPLLDTIEPYRRELFMQALHEFNERRHASLQPGPRRPRQKELEDQPT